MALPATGAISFNDINVMLLRTGTATLSLNDSQLRVVAGVPTAGTTINVDTLHGRQLAGTNWVFSSGSANSITQPAQCVFMTGSSWYIVTANAGAATYITYTTNDGTSATTFQISGFTVGVSAATYFAGRYILAGTGPNSTGSIWSSTSIGSGFAQNFAGTASNFFSFRVMNSNGTAAVAIGLSGYTTAPCWYTTNGTTWNNCGYGGSITAPRGLHWANGRWYLSKLGAVTTTTSTTFSSGWSDATFSPSISGTAGSCVGYGNGRWTAGMFNGAMYTSTDGVNFTTSGVTQFTTQIQSIIYANGLWIATITNRNPCVVYSTDGLTWTGATGSPLTTTQAGQAATNANGSVVMSSYGTGGAMRSNVTNN